MPNKIQITSPTQLDRQGNGIFSVDGRKMELVSYGHHEAIFAVLHDGKTNYDKKSGQGLVAVKLSDLNEESTVYKLGSFKTVPENNKFGRGF